MSEQIPGRLPEFPDLATPAARATEPPPFEHVVARARRHRRRRNLLAAAGVCAAVVTAVTTGALLDLGDQGSAPQPVGPTQGPTQGPTTTPTADAAESAASIIATGDLLSFAGGDDGSVLTVWRKCAPDSDDCESAWQLQSAGATHRGLVDGDGPSAHRAGDAYVVKAWNRKGLVVEGDGVARSVTAGEPAEVSSGDILVWGVNGLLVIDPASARSWPLPLPDGVDRWAGGVVGSDGTTWASSLVGDQVEIWWSKGAAPEARWQHHQLSGDGPGDDLPAYTAVAGDRVAMLSGSDGATILPVVVLAVTTDGGTTWVDLHRDDLPFNTVDAMAATSGGTLYVATAGGQRLYRSTDRTWTRFAELPDPDHIDTLVAAGDRVLARGGTSQQPVLLVLDDAGRAEAVGLAR